MAYTPVFVHDVVSINPEYFWMVIVGGIFCFCAAWGIGANDTANSWGSTVGAKAISVRNAAILAGIFEVTGAFSLGANVGGTLKSKIVPPELYCQDNYSLVVRMMGMLSVDLGSAIWLWIATKFYMPVSTTHAAVGGVCGFGIVTRGWGAVIWWETMGKIFISWVSSPLLSAFTGFVLQMLIKWFFFRGPPGRTYRRTHLWLPVIGGVFVGVAAVFAFYIGGKSNNSVKELPGWMFAVTFGAVAAGMTAILCLVAWYLRRRWNIDLHAYDGVVDEEKKDMDTEAEVPPFGDVPPSSPFDGQYPIYSDGDEGHGYQPVTPDGNYDAARLMGAPAYPVEYAPGEFAPAQNFPHQSLPAPIPSAATFINGGKMETDEDIYAGMSAERIASEQLWSPLCWVVASTESFSHGANDVGNAIGPYAALIDSYNAVCPKGTSDIPYWILGLGAIAILLGLVTYGHKVIQTLGVDIARMTPQRASAAEMATVTSVLIATALAIPVSTTHCAVGGITGVSLADGWRHIKWRTLYGVAICIVITVPACALMTAAVFGFIHAAVFGASYPGASAFNQYCNSTYPGPWRVS